MSQMAPARRPHYPPTERMAILELRAARGWSLEQTAKVFLVTAETIRSWVRRIDEAGAKALVQTFQPVNKFPDCVRYLVQRLKLLCPTLGKLKIAQILCRAGLHLGTTSVGRIFKEPLTLSRWKGKHRRSPPKRRHRPRGFPPSLPSGLSLPSGSTMSGMST